MMEYPFSNDFSTVRAIDQLINPLYSPFVPVFQQYQCTVETGRASATWGQERLAQSDLCGFPSLTCFLLCGFL
jgi:hypothetical protein